MPPLPDDQTLQLLTQLKAAAPGFQWESDLWSQTGNRRSPYRALLLFGLSPRTRDHLLVNTCRQLFQLFPNAPALAARPDAAATAARNIVRPAQLPFIAAAATALTHGVPRTREGLLQIKGVGDKIAECVLAYGWGDPALPLDTHAIRVLTRVFAPTPAPGITPNAPARLRQQLKCFYRRRAKPMADAGITMVDIHEILRIHGQQCCARNPACHRCPLSQCQSRRQPQTQPPAPPPPQIWNPWRELLYDPAQI